MVIGTRRLREATTWTQPPCWFCPTLGRLPLPKEGCSTPGRLPTLGGCPTLVRRQPQAHNTPSTFPLGPQANIKN
jgi:hypothetical protein